ncbi:hypothetical protein PVAP13_4NG045977 [Panicum virgatum]|uniref:Uncharacterized protein n=1 Tax=Panicum virgatum TaxID=38727 RepID=A0A8T0T682_PANVG|nr:hypothetical protein PVAP13_4NG045977 [Panicum virgatum]
MFPWQCIGLRWASKIWICCWIYFQIRTMLSGDPLVLCFLVEHLMDLLIWCCSKLPHLKNPVGKYASLYMEHILGYAPVKQRKRREDEGDMLMPASMP